MATAQCGKCGSTNISSTSQSVGGKDGSFIYCVGCGAIITWVPKPKIT